MTPNYNLDDNPWAIGLQLVPVRFEFTHATATTVSIAGSFNNWHPTTKSMQPSGEGRWLKEAFLPPGNYEYCLVVDDQYIPDPLARETVSNTFGGRNSIVRVASPPDASHSIGTANSPVQAALVSQWNRRA